MAGTSLAEALATPVAKLTDFDGHTVANTTIKVTGAGDGLSKAMQIEPREYHHGETVNVVIECEVSQVGFVPVSDTELLSRVHTLRAQTATIVDASVVADVLDEQKRLNAEHEARIEAERRRAKGEYSLDDEALIAEHDDGQHTDLRQGCPKCDDEAAATAAEADEKPSTPKSPPRKRKN